jgi:hypothetical protein
VLKEVEMPFDVPSGQSSPDPTTGILSSQSYKGSGALYGNARRIKSTDFLPQFFTARKSNDDLLQIASGVMAS